MADVGSLGQYKVVVTADYSQLQSQFKAMSDYIADMTKSITSNLNTSMISGFTDMGKGVNKVMESSLNDMSPEREATCRAVFGTWGFFRTMHGKTAPSC